jgi:hypothetical protein
MVRTSSMVVGANHSKTSRRGGAAPLQALAAAAAPQDPAHATPVRGHSFSSSISGSSARPPGKSEAKLLKASKMGRYPVHLEHYSCKGDSIFFFPTISAFLGCV